MGERPNDYAQEHYNRLMELRTMALEMQGHYGKWLVATLLLTHGAAIGFIANSERLSAMLVPDTLLIFLGGLISALICGFGTWINWSLIFRVYDSVSPDMRTDRKAWPDFTKHKAQPWIKVTFCMPIAIGIISVGCLIWGAFHAADAIRLHAQSAPSQVSAPILK